LVTGVGVAVLGVAAYVHLAVAGHVLSSPYMADLSVVWSVVFSVGYGLFLPVEQELTRVSAARRAAGSGTRPAWRRAILFTVVLLVAVAIVAVTVGPLLAGRLFGGSVGLVWVTVGGLVGLGAAAVLRGQSAGMARFGQYGGLLAVDGVLRMLFAVGLALSGAASVQAYGLILTVAPLLAVAALAIPVGRTAKPGPPVTWRELGHGLAPLIVSMTLGQFMLNAVIVSARLLAPADTALTAALLIALVIVRVPTLVFGAVQATLLSGLASAVAVRDRAAFLRLLRNTGGAVTALMGLTALVLAAVGPWLIRVLFAAPDVLGRADLTLLAVGTWAYLVALVLGQAVMTLRGHRVQMLCWLAGALVLVGVTLLPGPVVARLVLAYLAGNLVVAGGLAAALATTGRLHWRSHEPATT
jgi:O-antigen/teichoic acid export membrane protein